MKLAYRSIQIELTRRCNQRCIFCCRGDSQDLDLNHEVIDGFIDKNDIHSISTLRFSGGEPTLNGEALEYLVKRLIEKKIEVNDFIISINGLSYSQSLVNGLNLLNEYCSQFSISKREICGNLMVSQTQYHKPALKEVIDKFSGLPYFVLPVMPTIISEENILPYGNALRNNLTTKKPDMDEATDYDKSISFVDYQGETYFVIHEQYISSNGNVTTKGCVSYDMMDEYHIGNVKEQSIEQMYKDQPKMLALSNK